MSTHALARMSETTPALFDDFFKPWNQWFGNTDLRPFQQVPAVNIVEHPNEYLVSMAVPGMHKNDFKINIDGDMITISSEKEESKKENEDKYTRKEYSYSAFSRSFTLPDEVSKEKIEAKYEDGILKLALPRKNGGKKPFSQQVTVK